MPPPELGLLSPPISPKSSSHLKKNKTLRGALGAIMPDLYFPGTTCAANNNGNGINASSPTGIGERVSEELPIVEENSHRLHIRMVYDEHRNDLIINIIEGMYLRKMKSEFIRLFCFSTMSTHRMSRIS